MKVIAKIDNNRVLCEVTADELAMLHGFRSQYDTGYKNANAMEVGAECNLRKMVATSQFVRSMRVKTLEDTKKKMEQAIGEIEKAMDTVSSLEIFNTLSETEQVD